MDEAVAYQLAIEKVQRIAGSNANSAEISAATSALNQAKTCLRQRRMKEQKQTKRKNPSKLVPAYSCYPEPSEIPRDENDCRFTKSFDTQSESAAAAKVFFEHWGFVVFRDILTAEACSETITEIWNYLESKSNGKLSQLDPATYDQLMDKPTRCGLPDEQAIFTRQLVRNRQSDLLYAALSTIMPDTPRNPPAVPGSPQSIILSSDRFCLYPPTKHAPSMRTKNPPVHLDICPWIYPEDGERRGLDIDANAELLLYEKEFDFRAEMNLVREEDGPHHQGVLNLVDNVDEDGGTVVVPRFHTCFDSWRRALGRWEDNRAGQRRRGCAFTFSDPHDPIHALARRVPIRAGSLLLWDQRTVHGAQPNNSENFRMAQFVRGFRAGDMTDVRKQARAQAVRRGLRAAGNVLDDLSPLAANVLFGGL